ncbi:hypothetical protein B0I35DRAFT_424027 [Stachybotrys elegans]|uniref:Uncharacterized protein n=1 Tax=Stachybotrys elegans TaxID=80388 RepID=A0A8K0SXN3_9HYPO|nr:hypothetical protein B0I35DRAFT_424027 [Stachybotrys elegans]
MPSPTKRGIVVIDESATVAYCRSLLWGQLNLLSHCVANLHRAAASTSAQVDLAQAIQVSEAVRQSSLLALVDLYQRIARTRSIAKTLTMPMPRVRAHHRWRMAPRSVAAEDKGNSKHQNSIAKDAVVEVTEPRIVHDEEEADDDDDSDDTYEDDDQTTAMTDYSGPLLFQSEPPSPPPTPKAPEDTTEVFATILRPNNSVFALFCPEAMGLQVNLKRTLPTASTCSCGYRWQPRSSDKRASMLLLKEGFKLTERFLAKSHLGPNMYGCVLCTSRGRSERYTGTDHLKEHINASHTKWQLLHDADCRAG